MAFFLPCRWSLDFNFSGKITEGFSTGESSVYWCGPEVEWQSSVTLRSSEGHLNPPPQMVSPTPSSMRAQDKAGVNPEREMLTPPPPVPQAPHGFIVVNPDQKLEWLLMMFIAGEAGTFSK